MYVCEYYAKNMKRIRNIVFDLGGVLIDLDHHQAVSRFEEIGVKDAKQLLDPYEQKGFFLELENGKIDVDTFCRKLCEHTGKQLSYDEIKYAWMGFIADVPQYKLDFLLELRKKYKVYLLSNTNPIVQSWARSEAFTPAGRPISAYFDKMYTSYEVGVTKPDAAIFDRMIENAPLIPAETLFVEYRGWTRARFPHLSAGKRRGLAGSCPEYTGKVIFQSVFGGDVS